MFTSLRARFWLSYALVITTALMITAVILLIYLVRNPLAYRQSLTRLGDVEAALLSTHPQLPSLPLDDLRSIFHMYEETFNVRLLVLSPEWQVQADSSPDAPPFLLPPRALQLLHTGFNLRDSSGQTWIYKVSPLPDGSWLLLAVPRTRLPLVSVLKDELLLPFAWAGIAALVLSLFMAYGLARWIGDPLQRMVVLSRQMPKSEAVPLPPHGPREVQELIQSFNEMTARVQAGQRSQRDFVANVSHELKTPLTSIQGFSQAILDGTANTPETRTQAARIIFGESGRMQRMVLDLLDLARLDAGTLVLQRAPVDILSLLKAVVEKFQPQAEQAGQILEVSAGSLPPITGDGDRLAQVFTNLVDNALKYSPPGGRITLEAHQDQAEDEILIEVTDTGSGIPLEAVPHLFERFYRVDPSRTGGEQHGAGLGLAIVKEIVQAHGGTISVRSFPGEGSTFSVHLPLTSPDITTIISKQKK